MVLLLDEPFSGLDAFARYDLQEHLIELWNYDRPTMVFVTHDIEEALFLADRVVVMRGQAGRIHSTSAPHLPRPRHRADPLFHSWKQRLFLERHESVHGEALGGSPTRVAHADVVNLRKVV